MGKIINYQGSMDKLVWHKEFSGLTRECEVVVPVSHEVIFVKDGKFVVRYAMGRHDLSENSAYLSLFENGKSQIKARVYYIKKEGSYNIKWEASAPIRIDDPVLRLPVEFDVGGVFAIKIIDSEHFLSSLLKNTQKASLEEVKAFFKNRMLLHIKEQLLLVLKDNSMSIIDATNKRNAVSKDLEFKMRYVFSDFGVSVESMMLKKLSLVNAYASCQRDLQPILDEIDKAGENCLSCGQNVSKNANFCQNCGTKMR